MVERSGMISLSAMDHVTLLLFQRFSNHNQAKLYVAIFWDIVIASNTRVL